MLSSGPGRRQRCYLSPILFMGLGVLVSAMKKKKEKPYILKKKTSKLHVSGSKDYNFHYRSD